MWIPSRRSNEKKKKKKIIGCPAEGCRFDTLSIEPDSEICFNSLQYPLSPNISRIWPRESSIHRRTSPGHDNTQPTIRKLFIHRLTSSGHQDAAKHLRIVHPPPNFSGTSIATSIHHRTSVYSIIIYPELLVHMILHYRLATDSDSTH